MDQIIELPPEVQAQVDRAKAAIDAFSKEAMLMSVLPGGGQWVDRRGWSLANVRGYNGNHTDGAIEIMDRTFGKENVERMRDIRRGAREQGVILVPDIEDDLAYARVPEQKPRKIPKPKAPKKAAAKPRKRTAAAVA